MGGFLFREGFTLCSCGEGHPTWGACVRSKNIAVSTPTPRREADRAKHAELDAYESARRQGVQPQGTRRHQVEAAMRASEESGVAYRA